MTNNLHQLAQNAWHTSPEATALFQKSLAHFNAHGEFPLDIEAQLEALRDEALTDLWTSYGREYDQDGFEDWHGQLTVTDATLLALASPEVALAA